MRTLVTGASGFIGGVVCGQLAERGDETFALVRREGSEPAGTTPLRGDLADAESLTAALRRAQPDCVIHLAAEIASQRDGAKVESANIDGTRRLLDACLALGDEPAAGPRFVFSSTVVTGDPQGALLDEETALPVQTPYGRSKQEGERMVLGSGLPAAVVRPSHVYGPGGWYADEIVPLLRRPGRFAVIGSGENMWDVVHVDDVARAVLLAASDERATGRIYHVVDDEPITYYDFIALTAAELGVGPPRRLPQPVARAVAGKNAVAAVVRSARSSNARIKRELGWEPRFPDARAGVRDAVSRIGAG